MAYTYGPSISAVYIFVVVYIILTLVTAGIYNKKINPRRRFAVVLWMVIWIVSAGIQFFNNGLLVVGFASAVGILILFVVIENPEANIDRRFGCFNSYALTEYYKQLVERGSHFSFLEISFAHSSILEEKGIDEDEILSKILFLLKQHDSILTFKNINLGFILISEDEEQLRVASEEIIDKFQNVDTFDKEAVLVLTTQAEALSDVDEMFRFLSYIHKEHDNSVGKLIVVDESVVSKYKEQQLIEDEIDSALTEDRVEVFLQPIYSTKENSITSAEALIRIRKRDGEMLSPGIFIPVAEESGQILLLGERVFEKVCDFLKNTDVLELGIHYIEVNLSVIQCEKRDLANRLIAIIEKYQINPNLINLEITETASISARNILLENMKTLINYGFTFSLDDFGKGESNLMYVVEMPVSIVKLDYDMSKAFFSMPKAPHVVRAVVNMAHDMDLQLVAEGIETKEEFDCMCEEGIDYIQGYYYSKPISMYEFLEFLRKFVASKRKLELE